MEDSLKVDMQILTNEFIVSYDLKSKEDISIKLLQFLKDKKVKVEDAQLFNQLCDMIEDRYFN